MVKMERNALLARHTLKLRRITLSVLQINVELTKSSLGSEPALTAKMEPNQTRTKEAALDQQA